MDIGNDKRMRIKDVSYFLVTVVIIFCIVLFLNPHIEYCKMDSEIMNVSMEELKSSRMYNCEFTDAKNGNVSYKVIGADPNFTITAPEHKVNCIVIELDAPLKKDGNVQAFFARAGEFFSEEHAILGLSHKGDRKICFLFPEDNYALFRVDIDIDDIIVSSVKIGTGSINVSDDFNITRYEKYNWISLIILIVTIILLFVFERKYEYFSCIQKIIKQIIGKLSSFRFIQIITHKICLVEDYRESDDTKARKTANTFASLALIFGMLLIFLVPPMATPDENGHFHNICRIADGNLFVDVSEDGIVGSNLDPSEVAFMNDNVHQFVWDYQQNLYNYDNIINYGLRYSYTDQKVFCPDIHASINPCSYLSAIWLVLIAKGIFGISNVFSLWIWARVSNLLFSVIVIRLAILKTPVLRNTMFLLALMPMTFSQLCSVSYDVEVICGSFLLFSYSMKLIMANDDYQISKKDIFAVCFSCACLFSAKILYILLAIILFAISIKKFGNIKRYILSIGLVLLMGVLFYLLPTLMNAHILGQTSSGMDLRPLISNYNIIPSIIYNSLFMNKDLCISSFVGFFGWLNVPMASDVFTYIFLIILGITAIVEVSSSRRVSFFGRVGSFFPSIIIFSATIITMYVSFWGYGTFYARGLQGRYFIPIAIYLPIFLSNPLLCKFRYAEKMHFGISFITKCTAVAYLALTCATIFTAYWL